MSKERIELGSAPYDEDCAQLGQPDYEERVRRELTAFMAQLRRVYRAAHNVDLSLPLIVVRHQHDFGVYHEVNVLFNSRISDEVEAAYWLEANVPSEWDETAKRYIIGEACVSETDVCS